MEDSISTVHILAAQIELVSMDPGLLLAQSGPTIPEHPIQ